jgi:excisionase family DNA binding protein
MSAATIQLTLSDAEVARIADAVSARLTAHPAATRVDLLDVAEVAREMRVSQRHIRRMLATRELRATRIGRRVLVERAEVQRCLQRRV